jgi:hypothetical protein
MKQENPAGSAEFRLDKCDLCAKVLLGNWKQRLKDCCNHICLEALRARRWFVR